MQTRRSILAAGLALAAMVALQAPARAADDYLTMSWDQIVAAGKKEGQLVFYSWWGEEFWRSAGEAFQKEYGIATTVVIGDRAANITKVVSESSSEAGTIDVLHAGGVEIKALLDAKALYGPLKGVVPDSDKLDPKLFAMQEGFATNGYLVPVYRNQTGFLYDPERVPTPPQTWDEFVAWLDKHPGEFAFNDPTKGGSGQAFVQTVLLNLLGETPDNYLGDTEMDPAKTATWSKVWEWLNANEDKFIITASNNDSIDRVNQGEAAMAPAWDDDTSISLAKGTLFKRAKLYVPKMGMPGGGDTLGIPTNAPHKAAALLFIAYLTRPDVQKQMNAVLGSYLARTDLGGESALIPEEERQANAKSWLPGPYKKHYIEEFVAQVLQK
jgi:putative spermidine/putrescine transport system substrate-binding protein